MKRRARRSSTRSAKKTPWGTLTANGQDGVNLWHLNRAKFSWQDHEANHAFGAIGWDGPRALISSAHMF